MTVKASLEVRKKTLLVTGGCGFIGSTFVRLAKARGYEVVVLDSLTYAGLEKNLPEHVTLVEGDIGDSRSVRRLLAQYKPSAIVNLAAESHVDRSIEDAQDFIRTNVVGTYALVEAAQDYADSGVSPGFRFLHVSTDEVFGSIDKGKFNEESPYHPNSPYAASKAAADHLIMSHVHTFKFPAIITHSSNNYGPRQYPEKLIPRMILAALRRAKLPIHGDGSNIRDWIHVEDHCAGLLSALEHGRVGQRYCFGGNTEISNLEVVRLICAGLEAKFDLTLHSLNSLITLVEDRPGNDRRYAVNYSKAQNELGWCPWKGFTAALAETIDWYLDNPDWFEGEKNENTFIRRDRTSRPLDLLAD